MTGPVVPTPPAEVPQEIERIAVAIHGVWCRQGCALVTEMDRDVAVLVERMVAERVRAARDEALREAEAAIYAATGYALDPVSDGLRQAAEIVAELRETTP